VRVRLQAHRNTSLGKKGRWQKVAITLPFDASLPREHRARMHLTRFSGYSLRELMDVRPAGDRAVIIEATAAHRISRAHRGAGVRVHRMRLDDQPRRDRWVPHAAGRVRARRPPSSPTSTVRPWPASLCAPKDFRNVFNVTESNGGAVS
jgi:hypothetical protein